MAFKAFSTFSGLIISASMIAGCAVRPLPENVTRDRTYEIVQRIRCEVRDSLRAYLRGALVKFGHTDLAERLRSDPSLYADFNDKVRATLSPELQKILSRHDHGAVGYEFTFDISENNSLDGGVSIGHLLTGGSFAAAAHSKADKERKNKRNFTIIDNFETLIRRLETDNRGRQICEIEASRPNMTYPIAGSLGLDEFVGTYFNLYEFGSLANKKDAPSIFSDTLEFTTTISGDVGATLMLDPVRASGPRVTGAGLKYEAKRIDKHTLVITMALAPEVDKKGRPITAAEQNAEARALAKNELERQRLISLDVETSIIRRNLLSTFGTR